MTRILVRVREAQPEDAEVLTELVFASNRSWGYSDALIELWRDELTFTAQSFTDRTVLVAETDDVCVGVVAIAQKQAVAEIEDLWIHPAYLHKGLGRRLFDLGVERTRTAGAEKLVIISDLHAEGFHVRTGAHRTRTAPSQPEGRTLPILETDIP